MPWNTSFSRQGRVSHPEEPHRHAGHASGLLQRAGRGDGPSRVVLYEERAQGGAALLFVGGCPVDRNAGSMKGMIGLGEDRFIPGLSRLAEAAHRHGALIAAQLFHGGRYVRSGMIGREPVAPSAIASSITREVPREMTLTDIQDTIANFAEAAARAKRAGFDAVEVLAGTGYLISEFFSPLTNRRTDEYGGSPDKRMRFGIELAWAVREAVGPDFTIIFRIAGHDFMADGNTNREAAQFAHMLEQHGVDAFSVTGGSHETAIPRSPWTSPGGLRPSCQRREGGRDETHLLQSHQRPRAGQVDHPRRAGRHGRPGEGAPGRSGIPVKAMTGRAKEIVPCIGCNQGCLDRIFNMEPVECLVNPPGRARVRSAARAEGGPPEEDYGRRRGPAGLTAARTAARAGHAVTLYEKLAELGGQMVLAGATEERREMGIFVAPFAEQAKAAGPSCDSGCRRGTRRGGKAQRRPSWPRAVSPCARRSRASTATTSSTPGTCLRAKPSRAASW